MLDLKRLIRKEVQRMRDSMGEEERRLKSAAICTAFIEHFDAGYGGCGEEPIVAYMPFRSETDITPVLEACWVRGKPAVLPRIDAAAQSMTFYLVGGYEDLISGPMGIHEPKPTLPVFDDFSSVKRMLVPGLAFDRQGGRLGYGGGYYDRFFQSLLNKVGKLPLRVAAAFELQLTEHVPMEAHDTKVNVIITENGVYRC